MSKRGVKKVKYLRSTDEYQSNDKPEKTTPQNELQQDA